MRNRRDAGDDAAIEFRATGVDRNHVAARGISDRLCAGLEQAAQHATGGIWCAANHEAVGSGADIPAQPVEICLVAARARYHGLGDDAFLFAMTNDDDGAAVVVTIEPHHLALVADDNSKRGCSRVERVDHGLAAAEQEHRSPRIRQPAM